MCIIYIASMCIDVDGPQVRVAMCDLLLAIRPIRGIKFFQVVSAEQLLIRYRLSFSLTPSSIYFLLSPLQCSLSWWSLVSLSNLPFFQIELWRCPRPASLDPSSAGVLLPFRPASDSPTSQGYRNDQDKPHGCICVLQICMVVDIHSFSFSFSCVLFLFLALYFLLTLSCFLFFYFTTAVGIN